MYYFIPLFLYNFKIMIIDFAVRISEIRSCYNLNFDTHENKKLLDAFYELGCFFTKNFKITKDVDEKYILKNLNLEYCMSDIHTSFKEKYKSYEGFYNLDSPLRAIEHYFGRCKESKDDFSFNTIKQISFLISQLHYFAGISNIDKIQ